ncbi:MAG TPA: signal peptidase I [Solirubrobacteraceae bacterium]|nr:signal peptidase I [Solirubrobacteraceae bacterium]
MTVAIIAFAALAWWYLAPPRIGGSTTYVETHGISMEPRFHTGDLAIVRPAASYRVGEIVAYRSNLLHTVVLHRIVARQGSLYVFKGDNNDFIDPRAVPRAVLIGKLWLHIPRGGVALAMVHTPIAIAALIAILGLAFVFGAEKTRRRRRRHRKQPTRSAYPGFLTVNNARDQGGARSFNFGALLTASAIAAAVFVAVAVVAFTRPTGKPTTVTTPYTQQVTFGYSAHAPSGPVYPTGAIHTGDPIFLSLVHQVGVHVSYTFATAAQHDVAGTESIRLRLTGQSGWSRAIVLTPPTRFTGDHTSTVVTLDIRQIESLLNKVGALTGLPSNGYTLAVEPVVHVTGTLGGHPLNQSFAPSMNFTLGTAQLVSNGASGTSGSSSAVSSPGSGGSSGDLAPSQSSGVGTPSTAPSTITVLGISPQVATVRWLALVGLLLSAGLAVYAFLRKRGEPFEESVQIQAKYGHLIVPIVAGEDLGWPPVDVPNIKALARLAESGQRLILHNRAGDVDTYMVNDEGTVYRYQVKASKIVWGEWTDAPVPVHVTDTEHDSENPDCENPGQAAANAA